MAEVVLCQLSEAPPAGELVLLEISDRHVVLVNVDGEFFALDNDCPHSGGPLADGELNGALLECPWHFAVFDVRTGHLVEGLASRPVNTYPVRVTDMDVLATIPDQR